MGNASQSTSIFCHILSPSVPCFQGDERVCKPGMPLLIELGCHSTHLQAIATNPMHVRKLIPQAPATFGSTKSIK